MRTRSRERPVREKIICLVLSATLCGCALQAGKAAPAAAHAKTAPAAAGSVAGAEFYPSTYQIPASAPTLISNATVLTGTGTRLDNADVLIVAGRISAVGSHLSAPANATVVDGSGRWVTPGIIDIHSHLGVYPTPQVSANSDGNEATSPSTANVWSEHSVDPQDPGFRTALIGGVTTLQILPGSANLIGGRSVVLKNVPSVTYQGMKFPGAAQGLKMACGENPKRVYGTNKKVFPSTRMGNMAGYRAQWAEAAEYLRDQQEYQKKLAAGAKDAKPPKRDLRLDTLAAAFHHAAEAYKISDLLAEQRVCAAMWADWWGFKMEAYDGIPENMAMVDAAPGGCAIIHSDSEEGIQRLNQEVAKAMTYGERAGFSIPPERAVLWLTANPAKSLGLADRIGTLEPGKMADVVVWNGTPFSVYALADLVLIDGAVRYDRAHPERTPESDFLLGQPAAAGVSP